jgi:alpha-L-rhamnosidase
MEAYYENWMRDFDDVQLPDGRLPLIVPSPAPCPGPSCLDWYVTEPVWESAVILMHTYLYTYLGDVSAVRRDYPAMAAWLRNEEAGIGATGYIYHGFTFGDWSVPTNAVAPSSQLIGSMFLYESAKELADLANLVGQPVDARHFRQLAGSIGSAVNTTFYDADQRVYRDPPGTVSIGFGGTTITTGGYSQTANLLGLAFGLAPAADRQAIVRNLAGDVTTAGSHLATGANGTRWILPVLTEAGYGDLAYAVATNPTYPGWAHWFTQCGATTMWESWECDTSRSRDHAFMGTVDDWFFTDLAGIQPTGPAFHSIQIKPYPVGDLNSAAASQTTPLGRVASSWTRSDHHFRLTVDIPVGATARILVPAADHATVRAPRDATAAGRRDGYAAYTVGSGRYSFEVG